VASITIRNLDEDLKQRLRLRAAEHKRSMEEEARELLRAALGGGPETGASLWASIRRRFEPLGGVELEPLPRQPVREPPKFGE